MTDEVKPAKSRYVRFLVWYFLIAVALLLMLPWEAWFGHRLLPFAFDRFSGEFHGQSVSISLSGRVAPYPQIPIHVQVNMTKGICRVATNGTPVFSMGVGSAGVNSTGVRTLALDPSEGSGSYEVYLVNRWYRRVRLLRWVSASVMLFVLASVGGYYLIRWERKLRTGHAHLTDARQRAVSVLDPIRMHLLRQHNPIPAELLAAITRDLVPGLRRGWRVRLWVLLLMTVGGFGLGLLYMWVSGSLLSDYLYSLPGLVLAVIALASIWYGFRLTRLRHVRDVLLRHLRCSHCGYDLQGLPTDPEDGVTVCPECGCAWKLDDSQAVGGHGDG